MSPGRWPSASSCCAPSGPRRCRTARPPLLVSLGAWSYGVYLIHGTLFTILLAYHGGSLIPLAHGGTMAFAVHIAFLAGLTLPLAWVSWRLIEQPAMAAAGRVRRSTAPAVVGP